MANASRRPTHENYDIALLCRSGCGLFPHLTAAGNVSILAGYSAGTANAFPTIEGTRRLARLPADATERYPAELPVASGSVG